MKRIVPLLAAAVMASGCVVEPAPCERSITLEWLGFDYWNGSAWVRSTCANAGVTDVDVYQNGSFIGRYACGTGGVYITGVSSGTQELVVEGLSGSTLYYRDTLLVNTDACGDTYVDAYPAEGYLNLNYAVNGYACNGADGTCYLWYSLYDDLYPTVVYGYSGYGLTYPNDVGLFVPAGRYWLDWMQAVAGGSGRAASCTDTPIDVAQATTTDFAVTLWGSTPTCQ